MKNINLILNLLSLAAIIVLFILLLKKDSPQDVHKDSQSDQKEEMSDTGFDNARNTDSLSINLAYVNLDTVKEYYYYYEQLEDEFDEITKQARVGLQNKEKELQGKMENLESKIMLNLKTQEEAQQDAYNLQLEYENYLEQQQNKLVKMEQQYFSKYLDSLRYHVRLYNKKAGFDYIITHNSSASSLLYASPKLDVTKQVLESMNSSGRKEN